MLISIHYKHPERVGLLCRVLKNFGMDAQSLVPSSQNDPIRYCVKTNGVAEEKLNSLSEILVFLQLEKPEAERSLGFYKEEEMDKYLVVRNGNIGCTPVNEGQVVIHDGKSADIEKDGKTLSVSVTLHLENIKDALNEGVLKKEIENG